MTYWTLPIYARAEWLIYINKEYVYVAGDEYVFLMVYDFMFPQTKLSKTCMHYICSVPMLLSQTYFHVLVHWIQKWCATVIYLTLTNS